MDKQNILTNFKTPYDLIIYLFPINENEFVEEKLILIRGNFLRCIKFDYLLIKNKHNDSESDSAIHLLQIFKSDLFGVSTSNDYNELINSVRQWIGKYYLILMKKEKEQEKFTNQ